MVGLFCFPYSLNPLKGLWGMKLDRQPLNPLKETLVTELKS